VQRSYQLFKESESDSPSTPKIPRNSTPEEEKLFHTLVDSLISYREKMRGPLRFHNSQTKDHTSGSKNPLNTEEKLLKEEKPPKVDETKTDFDRKNDGDVDLKDGEAKKNLDKSNNYPNKGFTAEEEAAIEDDIYKQFGTEPFPNTKKESKKTSKKGHSVKSQTGRYDSGNPELSLSQDIKDSENQNIQTDMLLVLEELPSIMGIDKNVYGPLLPQDIVTIPEPTARILVKNQKGKSIQKYK
jgi:DNA replication factor GINS